MKIVIIYSTPTSHSTTSSAVRTDDDTMVVAAAVSTALQTLGHKTSLHPIRPDNIKAIATIKADCLFNLVEWTGRDMYLVKEVYKYIAALDIPYTGCTYNNYINTSDKARMKKIFKKFHIPTPKWQIFTKEPKNIRTSFPYPVIVKATLEHCSIGLSQKSLAHDNDELKIAIAAALDYHMQPILVEEFIGGREFQVTVLEKKGNATVLPIEEVHFNNGDETPFLTYDSKWTNDSPDYQKTTIKIEKLDWSLQSTLTRVAVDTFTRMGFRGYARFDIRVRDGHVYILEANANPNLYDPDEDDHELSYTAAGMTFAQYLWCIIEAGVDHYEQDHKTRHHR